MTSPTASAAFAGKLTSPGVLNSWRTQHSPQRQRLRWRLRCGSGCPLSGRRPHAIPESPFAPRHPPHARLLGSPDRFPPSPEMAPAFPNWLICSALCLLRDISLLLPPLVLPSPVTPVVYSPVTTLLPPFCIASTPRRVVAWRTPPHACRSPPPVMPPLAPFRNTSAHPKSSSFAWTLPPDLS